MTRHRTDVTLRQILDFAHDAIAIAQDTSCEALVSDAKTRYALLHLICVIGEAANRLPRGFRSSHNTVPWNAIINMRNRLIHGYDIVDMRILWDTVTVDLPVVAEALRKIVDDGPAQGAS